MPNWLIFANLLALVYIAVLITVFVIAYIL